jgi:hypothetical protein
MDSFQSFAATCRANPQQVFICNYCEHAAMECEPTPMNASSFAANVSMSGFSFAVNLSRKRRRMRARPVSNASRYK